MHTYFFFCIYIRDSVPVTLKALSVLELPRGWVERVGEEGRHGEGETERHRGSSGNEKVGDCSMGEREGGGGGDGGVGGTCLDRGLPAGMFPSDHVMLAARFRYE